MVLKKLAGNPFSRDERRKKNIKAALDRASRWKMSLATNLKTHLEQVPSRRIVYGTPEGKTLIVLRKSEVDPLIVAYHDSYKGVGAQKLFYVLRER